MMKNRIPLFLIYLRLLIGAIILLITFITGNDGVPWVIGLIVVGFLSDVFDGIIARKLGVSNVSLRKLDSAIDRIFWLNVLAAGFILHPSFVQSKWIGITSILILELIVFGICLFKFYKMPSPHNLLSKIWGILVAIALIEIIADGSSIFFTSMIVLGIASRFDSIAIHLLLKKWDHDIPSLYHAYLLRTGKSIRRNELFNG